jgi:hypothetical protein
MRSDRNTTRRTSSPDNTFGQPVPVMAVRRKPAFRPVLCLRYPARICLQCARPECRTEQRTERILDVVQTRAIPEIRVRAVLPDRLVRPDREALWTPVVQPEFDEALRIDTTPQPSLRASTREAGRDRRAGRARASVEGAHCLHVWVGASAQRYVDFAECAQRQDRRSGSDTFVQTVPRHRQQGGRHRGANPSPAHAQPHLGGKCALVGAGVRRLAFDRTPPPSEALGRIRDAFHDTGGAA